MSSSQNVAMHVMYNYSCSTAAVTNLSLSVGQILPGTDSFDTSYEDKILLKRCLVLQIFVSIRSAEQLKFFLGLFGGNVS
jgi:hypothetical protein